MFRLNDEILRTSTYLVCSIYTDLPKAIVYSTFINQYGEQGF